jgi:hypothetical protein
MINQIQTVAASVLLALSAVVIWYVMEASPLISNNGSYSGIWRLSFESSLFFPCDSEMIWDFQPETDEPYDIFTETTGISNIREMTDSVRLFVKVQGEVGPQQEFGLSDRQLIVKGVESASLDIPTGCDRDF